MTREFDYQWRNLSSPYVEYTQERVTEFLDVVKLPEEFFKDKLCLDAGCGNGRWTYALQQLGARVESFDISPEAVKRCRAVNPSAHIFDLLDLREKPVHDFVLSWGVLHHLPDPRLGFRKVASQVKNGGTLHIMVYHKETQQIYSRLRILWKLMPTSRMKLLLCKMMARDYRHRFRRWFQRIFKVKPGGTVQGWWDALSPRYNWAYAPEEIEEWFREEGFTEIALTQKHNININMRGRRGVSPEPIS